MKKVDGLEFISESERSNQISIALGFNPEARFVACAEEDRRLHVTATMAKPEEWIALLGAASNLREFKGMELVFHGFDADQEWVILGRKAFEKRDYLRSLDSYADLEFDSQGNIIGSKK